MPDIAKTIVTRLSLDSKAFSSKLSNTEKSILKFSGAVAGVGAAVFALAKRTANYRDETTKTARAVGLSTETYSELRHAGEQAGLTLDDQRAIFSKLSAPTEQQAKLFKELGVTLTDTAGNSTSTESRLNELADTIAGIQDPAKRTDATLKAFGEQGIKAVSLFAQGSKGLDETRKKARELGIAFSDVSGRNAEAFNDSLDNLTKAFTGLSDSFGQIIIDVAVSSNVFDLLASAVESVTDFFNSLDENTKGTVARVAGITAGVAGLTAAFIILRKVSVQAITSIGKAIRKNPIIFGISTAATGLIAAAEHFKLFGDDAEDANKKAAEAAKKAEEEAKKAAEEAKKMQKNLEKAAGAGRKSRKSLSELREELIKLENQLRKKTAQGNASAQSLEKLKSRISETKTEIKKLEDELKRVSFNKFAQNVATISQFADQFSSLSTTISSFSQRAAQEQAEQIERQISILEHHYDTQEETIEDSYERQVKSIETFEAKKTVALQQESNERLLLLDTEYQKAKELAQIAFEERLAQDQENYEIEKEFLLEQAIDRDQERIVESLLDEDFKLFREQREAEHEGLLANLQKDFLAKKRAEEETTQKAIKTLQDQSNTAQTKAERKKNADLEDLGDERKEKVEELEKKKAEILHKAAVEQHKVDKATGIVSTLVTGAQGVAQALPLSIEQAGIFAGPFIAAGLITAILAATGAQVAFIASQKPPPKPVLQAGGVLSGPSHAQGGITAELEGGEAVIDRERTDRLFDSLDRDTKRQPMSLSIVFESGSIQISGILSDEETVEEIRDVVSEGIAERIEALGI